MPDYQAVISAPAVPLTASGLVAAPYFPGFRSRLRRAFLRFGAKPVTFLALSLMAVAFPTLAALYLGAAAASGGIGRLLPGPALGTVITGLVTATGLAMFLAMQTAMGAAAAFKVGFLKALGVGLSRSGRYLMTVAASLFATVIPFLSVVPNVVFAPRLALGLPVVLAERRHSWSAMGRSRDLVAGHTLRLVAELFAINLLTAAVAAGGAALAPTMTALLHGVFRGPFAFLAPFAGLTVALVLWSVCQLFFMPLNVIYLQVFYEDCVKEKGWEWTATPWRTRAYQLLALFGLAVIIGLPSFGGLRMLKKAAESQVHIPSAPVLTTPAAPATSAASSETSVEVVEEPTVDEPAARDLARYERVSLLKIALASYQSDFYSFPATLTDLTPKYLAQLPADPQTNQPFAYVGSQGDYRVTFALESGVFALAPGRHVMTAKGFDLPADLTAPALMPSSTAGQVTSTFTPAPVQAAPPDVFAPNDVGDSEPTVPEEAVASSPAAADEQVATPPATADASRTDTDRDLLSDRLELELGSDPLKPDSDGDTLTDVEEILVCGTDPMMADTDGDGYHDGDEVRGGFNPRGAGRQSAEWKAKYAALQAKLAQASRAGLIIDEKKL